MAFSTTGMESAVVKTQAARCVYRLIPKICPQSRHFHWVRHHTPLPCFWRKSALKSARGGLLSCVIRIYGALEGLLLDRCSRIALSLWSPTANNIIFAGSAIKAPADRECAAKRLCCSWLRSKSFVLLYVLCITTEDLGVIEGKFGLCLAI